MKFLGKKVQRSRAQASFRLVPDQREMRVFLVQLAFQLILLSIFCLK
jgi:hypothetical protein